MATFAARALKELATKQGPGLVQVRRISRRPLSGPFSRPTPPSLSLRARARRRSPDAPSSSRFFSFLRPRALATHARTHARFHQNAERSLLSRSLHSSRPTFGGAGAPDYVHAPKMYTITKMKNRKLKFGLFIGCGGILGFGIPFWAVHYTQSKLG